MRLSIRSALATAFNLNNLFPLMNSAPANNLETFGPGTPINSTNFTQFMPPAFHLDILSMETTSTVDTIADDDNSHVLLFIFGVLASGSILTVLCLDRFTENPLNMLGCYTSRDCFGGRPHNEFEA